MGHLFRCLVMAEFLLSRGRGVHLLMRRVTGGVELVKSKGLKVTVLPAEATRQQEQETIRKLCGELSISTAVFDLVDGAELLADLGKLPGIRIVVIDEFGGEFPFADVIVDPRLWAEQVRRPVSPARCLLGPGYRVIDPAWLRLKKDKRRISARVKKVTISLGGADPMDLTALVVSQIARFTRFDQVNVVYGPAARPAEPESFGPEFQTYHGPEDFPGIVARSDLVVTSGGGTAYEVASIGLPMIIVPTIDHERVTARAFAERVLALTADLASGEPLAPALEAAMDRNLRKNLGEKCLLLHVGEKIGELLDILQDL